MSVAEKFEIIADAAYEKGEIIGYESGLNKGHEEGYASGYNQGLIDGSGTGDDYRNTFWGGLQNEGKPTNYVYAFYGANWTDEIYDPQHDFVVQSNANSMYYAAYITDTKKTIDISGSGVKGNTSSMFQNSEIKRIAKLKLKEDGSNSLSKCFDGCAALEEIDLEGKIGKSVSFADCPLSVSSLKNIILHLMDYKSTADQTYSITLSSNSKTVLEAEGATSPTGTLWTDYIDSLGWQLI